MFKRFLFFICTYFFLVSYVYAEIEEKLNVSENYVSQNHVLDNRQNYFLTSTNHQINPKVNPITGEYCEEMIDFTVFGAVPLSARRFYNSNAPYDSRYSYWRYNPECYFVANFEWQEQEIFASIGDIDGSVFSFKRSSHNHSSFNFKVPKNFLFSQCSGSSHPLNTIINYEKNLDVINKQSYQYSGTITDGQGRVRFFSSEKHPWINYVSWKEKKGGFLWMSETEWLITPNTWTPYQLPIYEERLPEGNILCYTYTPWKKSEKNYPLPQLLHTITAYNSDKSKILGSITFNYTLNKKNEISEIRIQGSDNRSTRVHYSGCPNNLTSSQIPGRTPTIYTYNKDRLTTLTTPSGYAFTTEYNKEGKVLAQYAPVGPEGENLPISRYIYENFMTQVFDAENNRIDYHFDEQNHLHSIVYLQHYNIYKKETFTKEEDTGNLLHHTISDGQDKLFYNIQYTYDKNHNPIEEIHGNDTEQRVIKRTFSDDGFNLKLTESDRKGKITCYTYVPYTNLISSELIYENTTIRKRSFYFYDDCAICIKTIIDDGNTDDPNNLQGVTYRKITYTTPKYSTPCFGLPEVIEEKTIDDSFQEILLKKIIYTYTNFGTILQEDHYDSSNAYCYSLYNTYDNNERLISKTETNGSQFIYTYDINNNIISLCGPRKDQYQEVTYDKVNRPIHFVKYLQDGTEIVTEKKYNKLGQITEYISSSGQGTKFFYDTLGRIVKTIYPDGGIECKEYDILGNVIKEVDSEGYTTLKTYNAFGQTILICYPDATKESFTYNDTGTISTHTDKNGVTTKYIYDIFDHPIRTEIYSPSKKLIKIKTSTWSTFCLLSEIEEEFISTYTYDYAGRKIEETKDCCRKKYFYDALGRLHKESTEDITQIKEYDLLGNIIHEKIESNGQLQKEEKYIYDKSSLCIAKLHSQGIIEYCYDAENKITSITDPLGYTTKFNYSYSPYFTKTILNPKGIQTTFSYNFQGKEILKTKKNSLGETLQKSETLYNKNGLRTQITHTIYSNNQPTYTIVHNWEYGPLGRLQCFIENGQRKTQYFYDSKGRLDTILKPDGVYIYHEYDDLGRLSHYYSSDFDYQYTYDHRNRIIEVYDSISHTQTIRNYDPLDNILKETLSNGLTVSNTYDSLGRKLTCTLPNSSIIFYEYRGIYLNSISKDNFNFLYSKRNLEGKIEEILTPVGDIHVTRDSLGRPIILNAPYFCANNYVYDCLGNLTYYTYNDAFGQDNKSYLYDDLCQLIQEEEHTYEYDSLYNRLKKDNFNYITNTLCHTLFDGKQHYIYDLCGNLISDSQKFYSYDSLNRLISVKDNQITTTYTYDAFNRRLSKTLFINDIFVKTVRYLWEYKDEIGSVDENNSFLELRVLGEGLGADIGASVLFELNGKSYVPIHDHRGSVVALIEAQTQTLSETYRYTAFGEEKSQEHLSPWRFSSKRIDKETGLIHFGGRDYCPHLGRWITQDPQGFNDGPNLYTYAHNRPLTEIDFYGLAGMENSHSSSLIFYGLSTSLTPYSKDHITSLLNNSFGSFIGNQTWDKYSNKIITLSGRKIPHQNITYTNGMFTTLQEAIEQASFISKSFGNVEVDLIYHKTESFFKDILTSAYAKLRQPNDFTVLQSNYFIDRLKEDALCTIISINHSRGAIQLMNTSQYLTQAQKDRICVFTFGPAEFIPKQSFKYSMNYISKIDPVPLLNIHAYYLALKGEKYNVKFLEPKTHSPLQEHYFLGLTYSSEIEELGKDFQKGNAYE